MPICGWQFLLDSNQNIQRFLYSAKSVTSLVTSNDLFDMEGGGVHPSVASIIPKHVRSDPMTGNKMFET
jgi:hypothetical protein